jgi:membrane protein
MLKHFYQKILIKFIHRTRSINLPGNQGVSLYSAGYFFINGLKNNLIAQRAASITFRFFLALFPLIIFLFSVVPYIPIKNFHENILNNIHSFFPDEVYLFFESFLYDLIKKKHSVLLSVGFLLTIYFSANGISALLNTLNQSNQHTGKRNFFKQWLWSLTLLILFFILSTLVTLVSGFGTTIINYLFNREIISGNTAYYLIWTIKSLLSLLIMYMLISVIYNIADTGKTKWKLFTAGAFAGTLPISAKYTGIWVLHWHLCCLCIICFIC